MKKPLDFIPPQMSHARRQHLAKGDRSTGVNCTLNERNGEQSNIFARQNGMSSAGHAIGIVSYRLTQLLCVYGTASLALRSDDPYNDE